MALPPKKHGIGLIIGIGRPRPDMMEGPSLPPPISPRGGGPASRGAQSAPATPQQQQGIDHIEPHDTGAGSGGKVTPEKALRVPADHHCKDCMNWAPPSACNVVSGVWMDEDACLRYFKHKDASAEEANEPSDDAAEESREPEGGGYGQSVNGGV